MQASAGRKAALAGLSVLAVSALARLAAPALSLYLEPWHVARQLHLWQLVTWIPAGASLTFLAHAALLAFALSRGATVPHWLGTTFVAGVLTTLLGVAVPAVYSCTFTGAGVGAAASLLSWASELKGPRRLAATALALVPPGLDAAVDGPYVLVPFGFAFVASAVWGWRRRRSHPTG